MAFTSGAEIIRLELARLPSHPTWDVTLLLAVAGVGVFFVFSQARRRIVALLIHTYIAAALVSVVPKEKIAELTGIENASRLDIALFSGIFLILFLFLSTLGAGILKTWWYAAVLIFLQIGLFLHIIFGFLPEKERVLLAPATKTFVANPDFTLWWFLVPIITLIVVRRLTLRYE